MFEIQRNTNIQQDLQNFFDVKSDFNSFLTIHHIEAKIGRLTSTVIIPELRNLLKNFFSQKENASKLKILHNKRITFKISFNVVDNECYYGIILENHEIITYKKSGIKDLSDPFEFQNTLFTMEDLLKEYFETKFENEKHLFLTWWDRIRLFISSIWEKLP
ncbi:MAG: hypothetical protein NZZ41_04725 [Candidatus Dojkabacteria bacterium]|nr:hypothetical protein [Candidatus Dojkabacteria bacterium]